MTCTVKASETNLYIFDRISTGRSRNLSVEGDMIVRIFSFSVFSLDVGMIVNAKAESYVLRKRNWHWDASRFMHIRLQGQANGSKPLASPL